MDVKGVDSKGASKWTMDDIHTLHHPMMILFNFKSNSELRGSRTAFGKLSRSSLCVNHSKPVNICIYG